MNRGNGAAFLAQGLHGRVLLITLVALMATMLVVSALPAQAIPRRAGGEGLLIAASESGNRIVDAMSFERMCIL